MPADRRLVDSFLAGLATENDDEEDASFDARARAVEPDDYLVPPGGAAAGPAVPESYGWRPEGFWGPNADQFTWGGGHRSAPGGAARGQPGRPGVHDYPGAPHDESTEGDRHPGRHLHSDPLSVLPGRSDYEPWQYSLYSTDELGHEHREAGPGGGQFVKKGTGGSGGGESGPGRPTKGKAGSAARVESILKEAEGVKFTDVKERPRRHWDVDEIEEELTVEERSEMEIVLDEWRTEAIDEIVRDRDAEYEIDVHEVYSDAGYSDLDISDRVAELVKENGGSTEMVEFVETAGTRRGENLWGRSGESLIRGLRAGLEEMNAPSEVIEAVRDYQYEASEELERAMDEARERAEKNWRDDLESEYDSGPDRRQYLRDFYRDHPDRFRDVAVPDGEWGTDEDGDGVYRFKTGAGDEYTINAVWADHGGVKIPDVQFSDAKGSFKVTGSGHAFEVFTKVVPAVVAFLLHEDPPAATFSAAEPSRRRLYDRLVKTVAGSIPGYFAGYVDVPGGPRLYVVAKKEKKDEIVSMIKKHRGPGTDLEPLVASRYAGGGAGEFVELKAHVNPAWWTAAGWDKDERTGGPPVHYEAKHAPAGGVTIRGKPFAGGEFIPADVMASASPEERAAVEGKPQKKAGGGLLGWVGRTFGGGRQPEPPKPAQPASPGLDPKVAAARDDYVKNGTRAAAFKAWFGDWERDPANASKVVNPETGEPRETAEAGVSRVTKGGKPVPVFHGSPGGEFEQFRTDLMANPDHLYYGPGFYFTEDVGAARLYAEGGKGSGAVLESYLNVRNPFDADKDRIPVTALGEGERAAVRQAVIARAFGEDGREGALAAGRAFDEQPPELSYNDLVKGFGISKTAVNDLLKSLGHDGITVESADVSHTGTNRFWVAFEPTQVKSVQNLGTFDPADPRMRYGAVEYRRRVGNNYREQDQSRDPGGRWKYEEPIEWDRRPGTGEPVDTDPRQLVPRNRTMPDKVYALAASMKREGWKGDPLLAVEDRALTGSHRLAAAPEAGLVSVPVLFLDPADFIKGAVKARAIKEGVRPENATLDDVHLENDHVLAAVIARMPQGKDSEPARIARDEIEHNDEYGGSDGWKNAPWAAAGYAAPAPVPYGTPFDPADHPRDDRGRFVDKDEIEWARDDPEAAGELFRQVTRPDERAKLEKMIGPAAGAAPEKPRYVVPPPASPEHAKMAEWVAASVMKTPGLDPKKMQARADAVRSVIHTLAPAALKRLAEPGRFAGLDSVATNEEVTRRYYRTNPAAYAGGQVTGYATRDGRIVMDGGNEKHGILEYDHARGTFAHELGHVLDFDAQHKYWDLSSGVDSFEEFWEEEIDRDDVPLSAYARTNPEEGFAEFVRALYGADDATPEQIRRLFPKCFEFARRKGII